MSGEIIKQFGGAIMRRPENSDNILYVEHEYTSMHRRSSRTVTLDRLDIPDNSIIIIKDYDQVALSNSLAKFEKLTINIDGSIIVNDGFECDELIVNPRDGKIGDTIKINAKEFKNMKITAPKFNLSVYSNSFENIDVQARDILMSARCTVSGDNKIVANSFDTMTDRGFDVKAGATMDIIGKVVNISVKPTSTPFKSLKIKNIKDVNSRVRESVDLVYVKADSINVDCDNIAIRSVVLDNALINCTEKCSFSMKNDVNKSIINGSIVTDIFDFNAAIFNSDVLDGKLDVKYGSMISLDGIIKSDVKINWVEDSFIEAKEASSVNIYNEDIILSKGKFNHKDALMHLDRFSSTKDAIFSNVVSIPENLQYVEFDKMIIKYGCDLNNITLIGNSLIVDGDIGDNVTIKCESFTISKGSKIGNNVAIDISGSFYQYGELSGVGDNVTFKYSGNNAYGKISINGPIGKYLDVLGADVGYNYSSIIITGCDELKYANINVHTFNITCDVNFKVSRLQVDCTSHSINIVNANTPKEANDLIKIINMNIINTHTYTQEISYVNINDVADPKVGDYVSVDGIDCRIKRIRAFGSVYEVIPLKCSSTAAYVMTDGNGIWAHGSSVRSAHSSLSRKLEVIANSKARMEMIENYKQAGLDVKYPLEEMVELFRSITGACEWGCDNFIKTKSIDAEESFSINDIIDKDIRWHGIVKWYEAFKIEEKDE